MYKLFKEASVVTLVLALATFPALAANFEVKMLNKGEAGTMVFEPMLSQIAVGDTVTFLTVDKGHDAETIKDLIPSGAEPFKGQNSKDLTVTFDIPGVYAIKCAPHFAMGMIALVVVGNDLTNLADIEAARFPKKAAERFEVMFAELDAQ